MHKIDTIKDQLNDTGDLLSDVLSCLENEAFEGDLSRAQRINHDLKTEITPILKRMLDMLGEQRNAGS